MRRTQQAKQETHAKIIEKAAQQFRLRGVNETGIAELMGEAGLTHGGFYAHFRNKEALVAQVCRVGMAQTLRRFTDAVATASAGGGLALVIANYLSISHRDHPANGCVMPTLGAEVARSPKAVRTAFTEGFNENLKTLAPLFPEGGNKEKTDDAIVLLAGMVGALMLARAVSDPALSERILQVNRDYYTKHFSQ